MLKRWIGRSINLALKPVGYELFKTAHVTLGDKHAQDALALHLRKLFPALGIETVLDVGANRGQYYDFLRQKVDFRGKVYSFEPIPEHAEELRARSKSEPNWQVMEYALGARSGVAEFNVRSRTGWSSLRPMQSGQSEVTDSLEVTRKVQVQVRSLDDLLPTLDVKNLYIKLDTQGSDLDVMLGGESALKITQALQTELECIPCYDGAASPSQVLDFLAARGFALTAVHPLWWAEDMRIGEADAVFKRMTK